MHPLEMFDRDTDGWNVFHHVCYRAPSVHIIRELLNFLEPVEPSYPMDIESDDDYDEGDERIIAMKPNNSGCTALHYACQYSSPDVVLEIIHLHPYAVSITDSEGLTTLHYACMSESSKNWPHSIFVKALMLLKNDPLLVTKNQHVTSPITLLCEKYEMKIKSLLYGRNEFKENESSFMEFWRVLILLVSFATAHINRVTIEIVKSISDPTYLSSFPLLHALLELPIYCKPSGLLIDVLLALLQIYPEQAQIANTQGNLPLHSILSNHHYYPQDKLPLLIHALITAYPKAVQVTDSCGRLPFHLALDNELKMEHGTVHIIMAYPEIVGNFISNNEKLFPFLLSEAGSGNSPNLNFELLKAYPSLVLNL